MGLGITTTGVEQATPVYTGAFALSTSTSTTTVACGLVYGYYNFALWGTFTGAAKLQRSFDGGANFINVSLDTAGDPATYNTPTSVTGYECERGVYYQVVQSTAVSSGTLNWRLSAGDLIPTALLR